MDYQGQNPNPGEINNAPSVNGGENPFLPPERDMGELGHSIIGNTPSMEEVMQGPIEVVELEQPSLVPGEMSVEEKAKDVSPIRIAESDIMRGKTISSDTAKEAEKVKDEVGKEPYEALEMYNELGSKVFRAVAGRDFGNDAPGDKAA